MNLLIFFLYEQNISFLIPEYYNYKKNITFIKNNSEEFIAKKKNGLLFPIEILIGEYKINNQRKFIGIIRDITNKKKSGFIYYIYIYNYIKKWKFHLSYKLFLM